MTRKTQLNLYLPLLTIAELQAKADAVGVSVSALADLCIKGTLTKVPEEQLKKWAASLEDTRGRNAGGPSRRERACELALQSLSEGGTVWRHGADDVAARAGLRVTEAYWALQGLRRRGTVEMMDLEPGKVDRWGRPTSTVWWLTSVAAERSAKPA